LISYNYAPLILNHQTPDPGLDIHFVDIVPPDPWGFAAGAAHTALPDFDLDHSENLLFSRTRAVSCL
jgi:hypothetical protein